MSKDPKHSKETGEEIVLKAKFCSLAFTSPHREQRASEVDPEKQKQMHDRSYELWKKLNPGYFDDNNMTTEQRDNQRYELTDFKIQDKSHNRQRDRHTDFVNVIAKDKVLARR